MPENWSVKSDYNSKWVIGTLAEAKGVSGFDLKMLMKLCSLGRFRSHKKSLFMRRMYTPNLYAQMIKVCINVYLHVNLTLLKARTKKKKKKKNTAHDCCHMAIHSPYLLGQFFVAFSSSVFMRQICGFIS